MGRDSRDNLNHRLARLLGASDAGLTWILIALFLLLVWGATYFAWGRFGGHLLASGDFQISPESLEVTPQPQWIVHSDVTAESLLSGSLTGLSSREPDLTLRVAQAFLMHPWVARVKHVTKRYPAKVAVDLDYRQPVGMVEVAGGRLPIDANGVLLPTVDFSAEMANRFPRITAGQSTPVSNIAGSRWGDDRIHGAAKVAGFLLPYWHKLELDRVIAYREANDALGQSLAYFVLRTQKGTAIIWGHAPQEERSGEPPADQKLVRLSEFFQQRGGLDVLQENETIDLRRAGALKVAALPDELN